MVSGEVVTNSNNTKKENLKSTNSSNNTKININTASQKELETLSRVGPKTAQNIINYRNENGDFKTIHDIVNVPRIGEKTFQNLSPYITVSSNDVKNKVSLKMTGNSAKNSISQPVNSNVEKININTATKKELESLPRIGPKTADKIIEYRKSHGPFKTIHDIVNVPRIGEKTFQNLSSYITVSNDEKKNDSSQLDKKADKEKIVSKKIEPVSSENNTTSTPSKGKFLSHNKVFVIVLSVVVLAITIFFITK